VKFEIDHPEYGGTYELLEDRITFAEARAFEKVTGESYMALQGVQPTTDMLQAFLWISMKRQHPTLTFSDLEDIEIASVNFQDEESPDPPQGADDDGLSSPISA
jgi:hypothetical protein